MKTKIMSHECNFQLAKTYRVLATHPPARSWEVYREDYVKGRGADACRHLRDRFDGPPCPQDDRAGRRVACLRYVHVANLTKGPRAWDPDHHDGMWRGHGCDDFGFTARDFAGLDAWNRAYEAAETRGWKSRGLRH